MKKIIFMGTPDFAVPILEALIADDNYQVVAVVSQPDRPVGRKRKLTSPPVIQVAKEHKIPTFQPEDINTIEDKLEELQADLIVTAAYGQVVSNRLLEMPAHGAINVHASLLPKYRGGAPIHHAVRHNDPETGVTIMYMAERLDAGDMIAARAIPITPKDDTGTMFEKLSLLGRDLLLETLPGIFEGAVEAEPQDESKASYSPNISREEEQINWQETAREINGLVRALRPAPGAYTLYEGERLKIWDTEVLLEETTQKEPGTVVSVFKKYFTVACGEGTVLRVNEVQPAGKKRMVSANFLNGAGKTMEVGVKFGE